jgi:hypothetical protein
VTSRSRKTQPAGGSSQPALKMLATGVPEWRNRSLTGQLRRIPLAHALAVNGLNRSKEESNGKVNAP